MQSTAPQTVVAMDGVVSSIPYLDAFVTQGGMERSVTRVRSFYVFVIVSRFFNFGWIAEPCLNNCSYPNGECVEGGCKCAEILNPYNRSIVWAHYEGQDCSFSMYYQKTVQIDVVTENY